MNSEVETETIIFSELSNEDKIRYFNFFLENDIIFKKDHNGLYSSEIKYMVEKPKEEPQESKESELKNGPSENASKNQKKKEYEIKYQKLLTGLNIPQGAKGTKLDLNIVRFIIEEIYSLKFFKDTQAMKENTNSIEDFPTFVSLFLMGKYQKPQVLEHQTISLLICIEFYGKKYKDINLFSKFLCEEYDKDDLTFYLFVRSCIEKKLQVLFIEKAKENAQRNSGPSNDDENEIWIPIKSCKDIGLAIYGDEDDYFLSFIGHVSKLCEEESLNNNKLQIKANSILSIIVDDYHKTKEEGGDEDEDEEVNTGNTKESSNINKGSVSKGKIQDTQTTVEKQGLKQEKKERNDKMERMNKSGKIEKKIQNNNFHKEKEKENLNNNSNYYTSRDRKNVSCEMDNKKNSNAIGGKPKNNKKPNNNADAIANNANYKPSNFKQGATIHSGTNAKNSPVNKSKKTGIRFNSLDKESINRNININPNNVNSHKIIKNKTKEEKKIEEPNENINTCNNNMPSITKENKLLNSMDMRENKKDLQIEIDGEENNTNSNNSTNNHNEEKVLLTEAINKKPKKYNHFSMEKKREINILEDSHHNNLITGSNLIRKEIKNGKVKKSLKKEANNSMIHNYNTKYSTKITKKPNANGTNMGSPIKSLKSNLKPSVNLNEAKLNSFKINNNFNNKNITFKSKLNNPIEITSSFKSKISHKGKNSVHFKTSSMDKSRPLRKFKNDDNLNTNLSKKSSNNLDSEDLDDNNSNNEEYEDNNNDEEEIEENNFNNHVNNEEVCDEQNEQSNINKNNDQQKKNIKENSKEFNQILIKYKNENFKSVNDKKNVIKKIYSDYIKSQKINKYLKNLLSSNPIFVGMDLKIIKEIDSIKDTLQKNINQLISAVFAQDKNAFICALKTDKFDDDKLNKKFNDLINLSKGLFKENKILGLNENQFEFFIDNLLDIQEFNIKIIKLLLSYID